MDGLEDWTKRISALEAALRPIARRPIDITDPEWVAKARSLPNPLDEAGVRAETEDLLSEVITVYPECDEPRREAIRRLFAENSSFSWAASLPYRPVTDEAFRAHLLLFSVKDQGRDTRDAILLLQDLCKTAGMAGVKIGPILAEVAALSSEVDKYGMGSVRSLLLREHERAKP